MIQASELRIGNFIFDDEGQIIEVQSISPRFKYKEGDLLNLVSKGLYIGCLLSNSRLHEAHESVFSGIPLCEDHVLKLGFIKGKMQPGGYYGYSNGIVSLNNEFGLSLFDGRIDDHQTKEFYPNLEFVHQFQNLYHALTGKELQYNQE